MLPPPRPVRPGPGQESVWAYPRPPAVEPSAEHVQVWFAGELIADSSRTLRVLETSHPPVYYVPRQDIRVGYLDPASHRSWCEFKGQASYADLTVAGQHSPLACWWYAVPTDGFEALAGAVAFYPERVDRCTVDGEVVRPVPGDLYGSWVTSRVVGPFKGGPGTERW